LIHGPAPAPAPLSRPQEKQAREQAQSMLDAAHREKNMEREKSLQVGRGITTKGQAGDTTGSGCLSQLFKTLLAVESFEVEVNLTDSNASSLSLLYSALGTLGDVIAHASAWFATNAP